MLTFGLLSPNKGFENVILALPRILSRHSDVVYIIAGATHPHVRRREGDRYRLQLQALAKELGVEKSMIFHNRFFSTREMASLIGSADILRHSLLPRGADGIRNTRVCLGQREGDNSTPYWHAAELLDDGRGALVPFADPAAIADTAIELLDNDEAREAMRKRAYLYARHMVWDRVAQSYMRAFGRACATRMHPARVAFPIRAAGGNATRRLTNASALSQR